MPAMQKQAGEGRLLSLLRYSFLSQSLFFLLNQLHFPFPGGGLEDPAFQVRQTICQNSKLLFLPQIALPELMMPETQTSDW